MTRFAIAILALLSISIMACAQKKITYVKMNRTACFGRCPVYSVELYKNGLVRYSGQIFTEHKGVYEKNVGTKAVADIFRQLSTHRADTCQKLYQNRITDVPGIYYTITYGKKVQKIANAHFGPEYLRTIAGSIDSVAQVSSSWKKTADTATVRY